MSGSGPVLAWEIPAGSSRSVVPANCGFRPPRRAGAADKVERGLGGDAARRAQGGLAAGADLHEVPAAGRDAHQGRVRLGQRGRRPDVRRRGPGGERGQQGLPFVGQAGKLLDKLLGEIGLTRGDVFVANVLKCRPPGNRDPLPGEIDACQDYLFRQLELIEPRVVCTLGNFATKLLRADPGTGITRLHGREDVRRSGRAPCGCTRSTTRPRRSTRPRCSTSCARTSRASRSCWRSPAPDQPAAGGGGAGRRRSRSVVAEPVRRRSAQPTGAAPSPAGAARPVLRPAQREAQQLGAVRACSSAVIA